MLHYMGRTALIFQITTDKTSVEGERYSSGKTAEIRGKKEPLVIWIICFEIQVKDFPVLPQ